MKRKITIITIIIFILCSFYFLFVKLDLMSNIDKLGADTTNSATFIWGQGINEKMKQLAGDSSATKYSENNNIKHFVKSSTLPSKYKTSNNTVSTSQIPIYMWFENGTIYWYSAASKVYLNSASNMFYNMLSLEDVDLSPFDTSNLDSTVWMFNNCKSLKTINFKNFNTSNVTSMTGMFQSCESLTTLDLSTFNTANATDMSRMFHCCRNLASLNLSSFNTSKVKDMAQMFGACEKLKTINLKNFNTGNVTSMERMFYLSGFESLDLSSLNTSKVTNMDYMFLQCRNLKTINLSGFNTSNITDMDSMFRECTSLTSLNLSSFNTSKVTTMQSMFYQCTSLTSINLSSFNTSNVTNMSWMFYECKELTSLNLSNFNTSKVTDMSVMFYRCVELKTINLSSFNTSNVTDMSSMFNRCFNLPSLNLSNFNTSKVTDMSNMFYLCANLTTIDLSSFSTSSLKNMSNMFESCYGLTKLIMTFSAGNTITLPNIYKIGHTFDGWYTANTGGTKIGDGSSSYTPSKTITLYARWTGNTATLTYDANGHGTAPTNVTMRYTTETNAASAISADGYAFKKWCTSKDGSGTCYLPGEQVKSVSIERSAITLYAIWEENVDSLIENKLTMRSGRIILSVNSTTNEIKTKIGNNNINVLESSTIIAGTQKIKTGNKLKTTTKEYSIVINGDTNSDGKVDIGDITGTYKYWKNKKTLSEEEKLAADANNDGTVNIGDLTRIYKISKGTAN